MRIPTHDGRRRRIVGFLLSVCTVTVLAACASGSASAPMAAAGGPTSAGAAAAASAAPASRDAANSGSASGSGSNVVGGNGNQVAIVDSAKIVRTGSLELQVADVTKALTGGREAMAALGGYIGSSQQQRSGDQTVATVTYRIPVARWEDALAAMRGLGTVISEATDAAEVTAQIVDLDARIRNLKASEVALVGYAEKAPKVSDLLEIQARLTDTRGQIEQLQAQDKELTGLADLATLTVSLAPGAVQQAKYNVRGTNNQLVTIFAPNVTLTNANNPLQTLLMTVSSPGTVMLTNAGAPGNDFSLGGSITVASTPEVGTAFTITLPVRSARHQPVAAAADGLDPDRGVQLAT